MLIGFIGVGSPGRSLARPLEASGHDVLAGVRDPDAVKLVMSLARNAGFAPFSAGPLSISRDLEAMATSISPSRSAREPAPAGRSSMIGTTLKEPCMGALQ